MEMGGNLGGWVANQNFCFPAQASEQREVIEGPNLQIRQEVGEAVKSAIQPLLSELVEAVRFQNQEFGARMVEAVSLKCAREFDALIPRAVEAARLQWAQDFKALFPKMVEEMQKMVDSAGLRSSPYQAESSAARSQHLHFMDSLPDTLHTLTKIQDLKVELRDGSGSRVEAGLGSSAKVRLVVLDGDFEVDGRSDWTKEEFNKNVAKPRKDRGPLLKGKSEIRLNKGVAVFTGISFSDNSKSMRNGTFKLGAEIVDGVAREAVSEKAFKVKERRMVTSYGRPLSLEDKTCRLKNIGDKFTQRLATKKIHTVKDFLQLYHTDAKALQQIVSIAENKLYETVKFAESCRLTEECYIYHDESEGVDLVLDCVFNVKGITFRGQTSQAYEILDDSQKELVNRLRGHAYEKREQLQRTYIVTNQIPVQVGPVGTSDIQPVNIPYSDVTADNQGEQIVHLNTSVQHSFGHEDGYHRLMVNQTECFDVEQWFAEYRTGFDLLTKEVSYELEASKSSNPSIPNLISDGFTPSAARTSDSQAVIHRTDELGTRFFRTKWTSIRAVVLMFKIAIEVSSPRAPKRQRCADATSTSHYTEQHSMHPTYAGSSL